MIISPQLPNAFVVNSHAFGYEEENNCEEQQKFSRLQHAEG
jgi:hypothetical protein